MGLLTDRINNKLERSNLINEHALNREPVPLIVTLVVFLLEEESATLFVVLVDFDTDTILENTYTMILTRLKEKLALIPDEPKLVVFPTPEINFKGVIPEALVVQFPTDRNDVFLQTMLEVFSKRWQTLDLVSMMHEVQRTFPLKTVSSFHYARPISSIRGDSTRTTIIDDRLSSLPRLQKTEENSKA